MSWLTKLHDTYNNCVEHVGVEIENRRPLLPGEHTTQKAQIEITIDNEGNFVGAVPIPKEMATTIIACTEKSASRANGSIPHALNDNLQYIAGDLYNYYVSAKEPQKTDKIKKSIKERHEDYCKQLFAWQNSEFTHPKIQAVYTYIKKGTIIQNLIECGVLLCDENGFLLTEVTDKANAPQTYTVAIGDVSKALCRFVVEDISSKETKTYKDESLHKCWIDYRDSQDVSIGLCYASGETAMLAKSHSKYIRNTGDGGKLISSNDKENFTYRGLFTDEFQPCAVGSQVSHKAHSALKWLISRQGYTHYGSAIVAWTTQDQDVPNPIENEIMTEIDEYDEENTTSAITKGDTSQLYANTLAKAVAGYMQNIKKSDDVMILALDAATTGRLSVVYYRELGGGEYMDRLLNWYNSCAWSMKTFIKNKDTKKVISTPFYKIKSPSIRDIIEAAYGVKADDKLKHALVERLLPCIVDGAELPVDIVHCAVTRTSNRSGYQTEDWDKSEIKWNNALQTTCAMFRKSNQRECYKMALEEDRTTRNYLFGRLLAVADNLESWALRANNDQRPTTASRYFARFAAQPFTTWRIIEESLQPYMARLGAKVKPQTRLLDTIMSMFETNDFLNNQPLSGEYLLGYHNQMQIFNEDYAKRNVNSKNEEETII